MLSVESLGNAGNPMHKENGPAGTSHMLTADAALSRINEHIRTLLMLRESGGDYLVAPTTTGLSSDLGGEDLSRRKRDRPRGKREVSPPSELRDAKRSAPLTIPADPTEWVTVSRRSRRRKESAVPGATVRSQPRALSTGRRC